MDAHKCKFGRRNAFLNNSKATLDRASMESVMRMQEQPAEFSFGVLNMDDSPQHHSTRVLGNMDGSVCAATMAAPDS